MRERRVLKVVHKGNEEAGNEACQWEQNRPYGKAAEWQLDEGPVPVHAAVGCREHPEKIGQRRMMRSHGATTHLTRLVT